MGAAAVNLAALIEHTCLKADATAHEIDRLCSDALRYSFVGVCVNPVFVARALKAVANSTVRVVTVVGFPLGATLPRALAHEARCAVEEGASEVDMVIPIGAALAADWSTVTAHVQAVRDAVPNSVLKVILETGYLDTEQVRLSAQAALVAQPQYLKTSTGFGPRGASVTDVEQLRALCPAGVSVKASGGIRTRSDALLMVQAGATRLGTSNGVAIVTALE